MADSNPHQDTVEEMAKEWALEQWPTQSPTSFAMRMIAQDAFTQGARWAGAEIARSIQEIWNKAL